MASMRRDRTGRSSLVITPIAPAISTAPTTSLLLRPGRAERATRGRPVAVSFTGPGAVGLVEEDVPVLRPGTVRVRTLYSGISSGTEMTAYRGSNVYLTKQWDPAQRLFTSGGRSFDYPVTGWGYSEVGEVVECADDVDGTVPGLRVGDVVYGIWGHRSEAVLPAEALAGRLLPPHVDPVAGVFARVGGIAMNAVLAADLHLGETVAVFGQGVIGLLTTRLAALSGARVIAVDTIVPRLDLARRLGASLTVDAADETTTVAEGIKRTAPEGADVSIEISGSYRALHEAVRSTAPGGRVVAAGFYQGEGAGLHLGEEFHHNRIQIVASQIGGVPTGLAGRWTTERLHRTFMGLVADGRVDVAPLISHVLPCDDVVEAYRLLDEHPAKTLEMILDFRSVADRTGVSERPA
jgi:2-desacetyl-2-hydroxyethyl bacteriochlorophyllide A dehydrogenase